MAATPEHAARILGLGENATLEDVRRVRRAMAKKHHPDCSDDPLRATRHMARINAAADTLTAHLKKQTSFKPKWTGPDHSDFASRKPRSQASARRAETPKPEARKTAQRTEARGRNTRPNAKSAPTPSAAELALIRMAAGSYRKVLDGISGQPAAPTVDARVLSYPGAHYA